jgi:hypothetical protein
MLFWIYGAIRYYCLYYARGHDIFLGKETSLRCEIGDIDVLMCVECIGNSCKFNRKCHTFLQKSTMSHLNRRGTMNYLQRAYTDTGTEPALIKRPKINGVTTILVWKFVSALSRIFINISGSLSKMYNIFLISCLFPKIRNCPIFTAVRDRKMKGFWEHNNRSVPYI